jgi:hypothetical protein
MTKSFPTPAGSLLAMTKSFPAPAGSPATGCGIHTQKTLQAFPVRYKWKMLAAFVVWDSPAGVCAARSP